MGMIVNIGFIVVSLAMIVALAVAWRRGKAGAAVVPIIAVQQIFLLAVTLFNDTPGTMAQWSAIIVALSCGLTFGTIIERWWKPRTPEMTGATTGMTASKSREAT